jgi:predicted membrane protein
MTTSATSSPVRRGPTAQVVFGLLIVVLGVLFTLDNLALIDARDYIRYWPAGLILVGLLKMYHAKTTGQGWISGLIFTGVGTWMLLNGILYFTVNLRDLLPLVLVALGGYMVWRGFGGQRRATADGPSDGQSSFSAFAFMGGVSRRSSSQTFVGADLTAVMGGCEIDLRQASIPPGREAAIEVFAFWGGIDIKVPDDWTVVTRAMPLMGGVEDKTRAPQGGPLKRLVVRGVVIMGGVSIKNRGDRLEQQPVA